MHYDPNLRKMFRLKYSYNLASRDTVCRVTLDSANELLYCIRSQQGTVITWVYKPYIEQLLEPITDPIELTILALGE